ncbi:MAG TPA: MBL fold metallo-hydrolase [Bacteroidales bacterium]|nr:MBL fold metallo-hydrolase [Bacteroidales bacterium]
MRITFLGTGTSQGVPVIACRCPVCLSEDRHDKRLRTSILVEEGDAVIVVDTGPDFRQQMLRANVNRLDAVVYTHEHRDHVAGLDDIRAYNFVQQKPMDIYAEERVIRALKREFAYIFAEKKYPGVPRVNLHRINHDSFQINGLKITPVRAMHYRLPVYGFRFGDFGYITDANYISEEEKEKLFGVKYLVVNALRHEKHVSHFTLNQAVSLINELSPRRGYLTHLSHQMGFHRDIIAELPPHISPAYDGLTLEF